MENYISKDMFAPLCPRFAKTCQNEGAIVPISYSPRFLGGSVRLLFAFHFAEPLPISGRGEGRKTRIMPQDGRGLRSILKGLGAFLGEI
ncbi:hypothetical protein AciPR4_2343 [Terriglobus saanensis SP1PR4]|uniref:Uncharacterized protein n=1 Tax=Terriglobus saanensis (strain ATCC BAA-1853 / DSM 23119 / SP1PR4) TaxID=401053 RepID=E8UXW0_TERSS|nr:hypothetical protein AciPR4_2343 [Terriglobus saanensis SP1PR4]